jgi:regulator of protease activity HflC (stomatin/prohibitin superfamily)
MNTFDVGRFVSGVRRTGMITVGVILGIILLVNMIVIVPAGQTGVYHLFGKVRDREIPSGIHLINPLATVVPLSIRTEQYTMSVAGGEGQRMGDDSIEALTKEGLKVHLDMTVLYHLNEERASDVYRELGTEYPEKLLRPQVRTAIRDVIALYEAKDIYSDKRDEAVQQIQERLASSVGPRGIEIESVLLRNVALPAMLTQAIESKLTAEQEAQRYDFVLQREEKEAERKRIEAAGQRDAQAIINESISDRYLQYLYIQNLEKREGTIYVPYDLPLFRGL